MKTAYTKISISIDPKNMDKLEKGKFNMSKLIDSLLDGYFKKQNKKKD